MCKVGSTGPNTSPARKAMINKSNTSRYGNVTKERLRVINSGLETGGSLMGMRHVSWFLMERRMGWISGSTRRQSAVSTAQAKAWSSAGAVEFLSVGFGSQSEAVNRGRRGEGGEGGLNWECRSWGTSEMEWCFLPSLSLHLNTWSPSRQIKSGVLHVCQAYISSLAPQKVGCGAFKDKKHGRSLLFVFHHNSRDTSISLLLTRLLIKCATTWIQRIPDKEW